MTNDPIADFLTRIRNALQRQQEKVQAPSTRMIESVSKILKEEGFIDGYQVEKTEPQDTITVKLKYVNGVSAIAKMDRISKPGVRRYMGYREIPQVKRGIGIAIFSTPKGIMTGKEARAKKIGGEYVCRVW